MKKGMFVLSVVDLAIQSLLMILIFIIVLKGTLSDSEMSNVILLYFLLGVSQLLSAIIHSSYFIDLNQKTKDLYISYLLGVAIYIPAQSLLLTVNYLAALLMFCIGPVVLALSYYYLLFKSVYNSWRFSSHSVFNLK